MHWYGFFILVGILLVYVLNVLYVQYKKISIDISELAIYIYFAAFLGGKIIYILFDCGSILNLNVSLDLFYGGFSLLGASFFALNSLLYYVKKNKVLSLLDSFLPISLLFLHSFGRIGCYFADCCGGIFYSLNLHFVAILFYFIAAVLGLFLNHFRCLLSFCGGVQYYILFIFLERFIFDSYRFDAVFVNSFFTKYQIFALWYLFLSFFSISFFKKKSL
jgi:prolipoprotein diacylglyceryltransferase